MKLKIPHDIGKSTGIKTKERKEQNYLQDEYICIYFLIHSRNLANCGKLNIKRIQIQKSKTLKYPPANNFNSGISTIPLYQFCLIRKQNKWKTHGGGRGEEEEEYIFTYRARWINKTTIWNFVAFRNYPVYTCTMPIHTHLARIKRGRMDGQEINYFFALATTDPLACRFTVGDQKPPKNRPHLSLFDHRNYGVLYPGTKIHRTSPSSSPPPILAAIKSADALWHSSTLPINLILRSIQASVLQVFYDFFFFFFLR